VKPLDFSVEGGALSTLEQAVNEAARIIRGRKRRISTLAPCGRKVRKLVNLA